MIKQFVLDFRNALLKDFTSTALKFLIISVALFWVILALSTDNKWTLTGIAAYLILP